MPKRWVKRSVIVLFITIALLLLCRISYVYFRRSSTYNVETYSTFEPIVVTPFRSPPEYAPKEVNAMHYLLRGAVLDNKPLVFMCKLPSEPPKFLSKHNTGDLTLVEKYSSSTCQWKLLPHEDPMSISLYLSNSNGGLSSHTHTHTHKVYVSPSTHLRQVNNSSQKTLFQLVLNVNGDLLIKESSQQKYIQYIQTVRTDIDVTNSIALGGVNMSSTVLLLKVLCADDMGWFGEAASNLTIYKYYDRFLIYRSILSTLDENVILDQEKHSLVWNACLFTILGAKLEGLRVDDVPTYHPSQLQSAGFPMELLYTIDGSDKVNVFVHHNSAFLYKCVLFVIWFSNTTWWHQEGFLDMNNYLLSYFAQRNPLFESTSTSSSDEFVSMLQNNQQSTFSSMSQKYDFLKKWSLYKIIAECVYDIYRFEIKPVVDPYMTTSVAAAANANARGGASGFMLQMVLNARTDHCLRNLVDKYDTVFSSLQRVPTSTPVYNTSRNAWSHTSTTNNFHYFLSPEMYANFDPYVPAYNSMVSAAALISPIEQQESLEWNRLTFLRSSDPTSTSLYAAFDQISEHPFTIRTISESVEYEEKLLSMNPSRTSVEVVSLPEMSERSLWHIFRNPDNDRFQIAQIIPHPTASTSSMKYLSINDFKLEISNEPKDVTIFIGSDDPSTVSILSRDDSIVTNAVLVYIPYNQQLSIIDIGTLLFIKKNNRILSPTVQRHKFKLVLEDSGILRNEGLLFPSVHTIPSDRMQTYTRPITSALAPGRVYRSVNSSCSFLPTPFSSSPVLSSSTGGNVSTYVPPTVDSTNVYDHPMDRLYLDILETELTNSHIS